MSEPNEPVVPGIVASESKPPTFFEGCKVTQPKVQTDYAWVAMIGFGPKPMGGVGDSAEEATLAMIEQVLVSMESRLTEATKYNRAPGSVLPRVRALVAKFVLEVRALHKTVLDEKQWNAVVDREHARTTAPQQGSTRVRAEDVGDDFI